MNRDWKVNNELIFAQPSNLRFLRGAPARHAAIEVCPPRDSARVMDLVVLAATLVALVLGLCFG